MPNIAKLKLLFFLFTVISKTVNCQNFSFTYDEIGLGSNRGVVPSVRVAIFDTTLIYSFYEGIKTPDWVSQRGDTIYKHVLTSHQTTIDKKAILNIISVIKNFKGKSIIASNPLIMSGKIQEFYFELDNSCVSLSLKNTSDLMTDSVMNIINQYLPEQRKMYRFFAADLPENKFLPLISTCPSDRNKTYSDYLKDDYKIIRNSGN